MGVVNISIIEPQNHTAYEAVSNVDFKGALVPPLVEELKGVPLYYRWYSSLNTDYDDKNGTYYSMHETALTSANAVYTNENMSMGSHVITFAVTDMPGETDDELENIQHGGVTGGLEGDQRCVIHIFKANILNPANEEVARQSLELKAEAPWAWANPGYSDHNRLRYRWELVRQGDPPDKPPLEFRPDAAKLSFQTAQENQEQNIPRVIYEAYKHEPSVPYIATGVYEITLIVDDTWDKGIGQDTQTISVTLT